MDLAGAGDRDERDGYRDQPGRRRPARGARSQDRGSQMSGEPLIEIRNLTIRYREGDRQITAVRDVSFALKPGGSLAIVGESGSGKSSVAGAVLDFLGPRAEGDGAVLFEGQHISRPSPAPRPRMLGRRGRAAVSDSFS